MSKKMLAAICLVMMFSLTACSDGAKETNSSPTSSPEAENKGTTDLDTSNEEVAIRFTWWGDTTRHEKYNAICDAFEKETGIKVEREPNSWTDYWDKLAVQVAGGTAPDVIGMHSQFVSDYAMRDALLDLEPYIEDGTIETENIPDSVLETGRVNGKIRMIGQGVTTASLITNKTLLDEYGITYPAYDEDWTMDEFMAAGEAFVKATDGKIWFTNDWGSGSMNNLRYYAKMSGGEAYTEDGQLGFTQTMVEEWFTWWDELRKKGIAPDAASSTEDGTNALEQKIFTVRKAAMHNVPANQLYLYQEQMPEDEIVLLRQPIKNDGSQGAIIEGAHNSVPVTSQHPKEAAMFINFFVNNYDAVSILQMEQGVPINTKLTEEIDPLLSEPNKICRDFVNSYLEVATNFVYAPTGALEIDTAFKNAGSSVAYGQATPAEAAASFMKEAQAIIDKNK